MYVTGMTECDIFVYTPVRNASVTVKLIVMNRNYLEMWTILF